VPDSLKSRIELTLDSTLDSVAHAERETEILASRAGFSEEEIQHLAMAVRETLINAILHGNTYSTERKVHVSFSLESSALTITIVDSGDGFDAESLPNPLAPENILKGSGRGLFLAKSFMDEVNFRRLHPGMEVTLIKRRS